MATNVQRSGFEKFFRRKSRSPEPPKEPEKNAKKSNEDVSSKVEDNTSKSREISDKKLSDGKNENDDAASQRTDGSKKSSKNNKQREVEETKKNDTKDDSEAVKEYMIKDDVGQVKLTEIINNSIKEAVLNIVKEGVCPLADSLCKKEPSKKLIPATVEKTQDKENKPDSPKHPLSLLSSTNKTFESHLCHTQYQSSTQHQPSNSSRNPQKSNDHDKSIVTQSNRELCPWTVKERKTKATKQKDKKIREVCCPKIPRQAKGNSHFKTDNRRMTGNVNIYICSEANENTKDSKKKPKDGDPCVDESESASETKTSASTVSVSTSKLVAALRKKQRKHLDNDELSCLCDIPECSTKQNCSVDKSDESDQVLCLCDENVDTEFPETRSSSSKDGCLYEDTKFSDLDCPCSDPGPGSDLASFDRYSYDKDDSWSCTIDDCPSYKTSSQRFKPDGIGKNDDWDLDEGCSCCDLKRCQKDRSTAMSYQRDRKETGERKSQQATDLDECCSCCNLKRCQKEHNSAMSYQQDQKETGERKNRQATDLNERCSCCDLKRCQKDRSSSLTCQRDLNETEESKSRQSKVRQRESRDRMSRTQRDENGQQSVRCPCIIEEEDESPEEPEQEFTVCINRPISEDLPTEEQQNKMRKRSSEYDSDIVKREISRSSNSISQSPPVSPKYSNMMEQKYDMKVDEDSTQAKPKSPTEKIKQGLDAHRSYKKETAKVVPEPSRESKNSKGLRVLNGKRKESFLYRSIKKAMNLGKTRKSYDPVSNDGDDNIEKSSPEVPPSPKKDDDVSYPEEKKEDPDNIRPIPAFESTPNQEKRSTSKISTTIESRRSSAEYPGIPSTRESINVKPIPAFESVPNPEKRSRSRISTAIASRRSSAVGSKDSSNMSILHDQPQSDTKQESNQCKCKKPPESCDCSCKKLEPMKPVKDEICKCCTPNCREGMSSLTVCCRKLEKQKLGNCVYCPICQNPPDGCDCQNEKPETEAKSCKCCPRCRRQIAECKCYKRDNLEDKYCKCCCQSERQCCCEPAQKSRMTRSQPVKWCRSPEMRESCRRCVACCRPNDECRCQRRCPEHNEPGLKSMICIYCDNPQDICICRAPIRKCSQCCMPLDVCNCKPTPCCDCSGRQIVPSDDCNDQTICVTAWKPRRNVRRYFARSMDDGDGITDEDCACWERPKPYGSDRLAYQKRGVFSDVMSELQQKMSGSVCCNICRKEPCCCCCIEREPEDKIEMRPCLSPIAERRSPGRSQKRSRSNSPADSCKCAVSPRRKNYRQASPSRICDRCRTSPCRCRRSSKSPLKKPQAKCYYCKNLPCVCVPLNENPRPFRNVDSSNRRRKERCSPNEGKIKDEIVIEDNGRQSKRFISCPGNQQKIRKYCYRGNSTGHPLHAAERVR